MIAWLGCAPPDPELASRRAALDAWEAAKSELDAHHPDAALAHLDDALRARPDDPVLLAWRAKALADSGDLPGAIHTAERALALRGDLPELRYNLAAWLARSGDATRAADTLRAALQAGFSPLSGDVFDDPDLAPFRSHPAFVELIPRSPLRASITTSADAVFWGSTASIRLTVTGVRQGVVATGPLTGPATLLDVVEDVSASSDTVSIVWTIAVDGPGAIVAGPIEITSDERHITTAAVTMTAQAPPGRTSAAVAPRTLVSPEQVAKWAGQSDPGAAVEPRVARTPSGDVIALATPEDQPVVSAPTIDPVRYVYRVDGTPRWTGWVWPSWPADAALELRRGATVRAAARP